MAEINGNDIIKVIAFYLPQFHCIPENDEAWGKGFTEWTNVKRAMPLFEGHYQPKIPLNNNYYNLLDSGTAKWQAELAKKFGIFGFCYYHYWFKDSKKLLEKPAEKMLADKSIKFPFCFCWANENWSKRWDGGNQEVIVEQDYGSEQEWEIHIQYLINFFHDERYITLDGKPVLIIYKPEIIPNVDKMLKYFKKRCFDSGLKGLEIMVQYPNYWFEYKKIDDIFDHYICFEPLFSLKESAYTKKNYKKKFFYILKGLYGEAFTNKVLDLRKKIRKKTYSEFNYNTIWEQILNRKIPGEKFIVGAFTDWDNSARNRNGMICKGSTPELFEQYFSHLCKKVQNNNQNNKNPKVIFVTAWNEWGEGAYLEPDERHEHRYLQGIANSLLK